MSEKNTVTNRVAHSPTNQQSEYQSSQIKQPTYK